MHHAGNGEICHSTAGLQRNDYDTTPKHTNMLHICKALYMHATYNSRCIVLSCTIQINITIICSVIKEPDIYVLQNFSMKLICSLHLNKPRQYIELKSLIVLVLARHWTLFPCFCIRYQARLDD